MNLRYQEWLSHVFNHEAKSPQWYFEVDAPRFEAADDEMVNLISHTFRNAGRDLAKYTDAQVDQGIWYLAGTSGASFLNSLIQSKVPSKIRLETIQNIFHLYSDCFAKRCTETLGHLSEEGSPLNSSCYMFWDISPLTCLENVGDVQEMQNAVLSVLGKILTIEHTACCESALHGLSEMFFSRQKSVQEIIDLFLSKPKQDVRLLVYAQKAREGNVL